ncbi:PQQ-dependent sugar dehydrogenase [Halocola ammonii]
MNFNLPTFCLFVLLLLKITVGHSQDYEFAVEGFTKEMVVNSSEVGFPSGITFDENNQAYIWTKEGKVFVMTPDGEVLPDPILDLTEEVGSNGDHGLLGLALDPNFTENGLIYLAYKVERNYLLYYGTPDYDPENTIYDAASIGRVTRYQANVEDNFQSVDLSSRFILLGDSIHNGVPQLHTSHGMGTLEFGDDGTLLIGTGDGSTYSWPYTGEGPPYNGAFVESALEDGIIPPEQERGSYRAQMVQSYNGKILRIDPETGMGLPSNPYYDPQNPHSAQSKVWSLGFRNPYRFRILSGTGSTNPADGDPGTIYIGDVGSGKREEINIANRPEMNFGWPHFEGILQHETFVFAQAQNLYAPNPLYGTGSCELEFFRFDDLLKQDQQGNVVFSQPCSPDDTIPYPYTFEHSTPAITYTNKWQSSNTQGYIPQYNSEGVAEPLSIADPESGIEYDSLGGYAAIGGDFYSGESFPQDYHELFFIADYDGWIKAFEISEDGELLLMRDFLDQEGFAIYHIEYNPHEDALYILEFPGHIKKIYFGQSEDPVAEIEPNTTFGNSPLSVTLDGSGSYSPVDSELTFQWTVDGEEYTDEILDLELTSESSDPEEIVASLVVKDELERKDSTSVSISLNNSPPGVDIAPFNEGEFYPLDHPSSIPLTAWVSDSEESESDLNPTWTGNLHHNTHYHIDITHDLFSTVYNLSTVGCHGPTYYYRIQIDVEDNYGLATTEELEIHPYCGEVPTPAFTNFDYSVVNTGPLLSWNSTHPENIDKVIVLRGKNQFDLYPIDTVQVNGDISKNTYLDHYPPGLTNYYSLKIMTEENVFRFSKVKKVISSNRFEDFTVFPNPAVDQVRVLSKAYSGPFRVRLISSTGQLVLDEEGTSENNIEFDLSVSDFQAGIYFIQLETNSFTSSKKLMIGQREE